MVCDAWSEVLASACPVEGARRYATRTRLRPVANGAAAKGYVIGGGWIKTWFEHMLEMERRRLSLAGHGANEQQLQQLDLMAAWSTEAIELAHTGHTFEHYDSLQRAFAGETGPFDKSIAQTVGNWFLSRR